MSNLKSGVYRTAPRGLRIRPKEASKMVAGLSLSLQYTANLLVKYIKSEYSSKGLKGIESVMPQILALDKVSNSYLKLARASRSFSAMKDDLAKPLLSELVIGSEGEGQ